ncbi:phosphatase 2C-like domain-containing protein [Podospora didyma]|uniref:Phosphatase 2C-like domain-containing protein n=1 Tax=Podospora didyma TaxID=330526 RepID=A0AAE0NWR7_9PEZI|nr:phosphatase 2C-like domain-containing protein [Podospora didyma]
MASFKFSSFSNKANAMFITRILARSSTQGPLLMRLQSTSSSAKPDPSSLPFLNLKRVGVVSLAAGAGVIAYKEFAPGDKPAPAISASKTAGRSSSTDSLPKLDVAAGYPFDFLTPPSPTQVTAALNETTWSVSIPASVGTGGVSSYAGSRVPANIPTEDAYIHGSFPSPSSQPIPWLAWGVFDGHLGGQTSNALTKHLLPYVHRHLAGITAAQSEDAGDNPDAAIHRTLKAAFNELDDAFISPAQQTLDSDDLPLADKVSRITTGSNGSCALLSLWDPSSRKLHVACTGDSRAVMGVQTPEGTWQTVALSVDQGGDNPLEEARVYAAHPGEEGLVKGKRVLGLATARAFGDGHWKWPLALQAELRRRFVADTLRQIDPKIYKTPPYITAEPEVTTTAVPESQKAFMIMASDGLWDTMTSEQAVDLVARWLVWSKAGKPAPEPVDQKKFGKFDFVSYYSGPEGYKVVKDDNITVQDENVAVHLTRNALGGANQDMVSAMLSLKPPYSRWVRDDITIQVVFFN